MRSPLLVLLTLAVATAPATAVRVVDTRAVKQNRAEQKAAEETPEQTGRGQNGDQNAEPKQQQKQKRVPAPTELKKLTPAQTAGNGGSADDDDIGPGERPELAPALYARRLPTTPRVAEPSRAPGRASIVSGHLSLPPPLS